MCEPTHSIVQFPDQDDKGDPIEAKIDALPSDGIMKKIGSWLHISHCAYGHSEALGRISPMARLFLPRDTKYEAQWWDRSVHRDGSFHGPEYNRVLALDAATCYANKVSIGTLGQVRQFLENSIRKSEMHKDAYIARYINNMLNRSGREAFLEKIKNLFGVIDPTKVVRDVILGWTRKRGFLVPEWADDPKLWIS